MRQERQENSMPSDDTGTDVPRQAQRRSSTGADLALARRMPTLPALGARSLFRTWFAMHERCAVCGLRFEREQGYFLGAIYINYGVTVVLALLGSFALEYWTQPSLTQELVLWIGFGTAFPVLFFPYSRGLWLGVDYLFDPSEAAEWKAERS